MLKNIKDKNILITGSAGFIGSHLTETLVKANVNVIGIDNFYNGLSDNLKNFIDKPNFKFYQGDIRDGEFIQEISKDIDIIFHVGAFISAQLSLKMSELCNDVNVKGTLNLLNAARLNDVERFVFSSSSALYGDGPELPKHERMYPDSLTPYGVSKLAGESYTTTFYKVYGLKTTALRYFNVYGPRQRNTEYAGVISLFTEGILREGKNPIIYGDGNQTRDFIYVNDIVKANILAATHSKSVGQIFNVATEKSIDINSLTKLILKYTNREDLEIKYAPPRKGDILYSQADITKIQMMLGFKPKYTIEEGLKEYIDYLSKFIGNPKKGK